MHLGALKSIRRKSWCFPRRRRRKKKKKKLLINAKRQKNNIVCIYG